MKKFLFTLFVLMATTLFATNAHASEVTSVVDNTAMEITKTTTQSSVQNREIVVVVQYPDGTVIIVVITQN